MLLIDITPIYNKIYIYNNYYMIITNWYIKEIYKKI